MLRRIWGILGYEYGKECVMKDPNGEKSLKMQKPMLGFNISRIRRRVIIVLTKANR